MKRLTLKGGKRLTLPTKGSGTGAVKTTPGGVAKPPAKGIRVTMPGGRMLTVPPGTKVTLPGGRKVVVGALQAKARRG
jgi:hypothetical protein